MRKINDLFQELGISKVRLAKYLGVSRQMVYNYLDLNDLNKLPKEKKLLILRLLDIEEPEELDKIEITTDYLMAVESRLNQGVKNTNDLDTQLDLKGLSKDSQVLVNDIVYILKDKLLNDGPKQENYNAMLYLYHLLNQWIMFLRSNISLLICLKQQVSLLQKNINSMKNNNSFLKVSFIQL